MKKVTLADIIIIEESLRERMRKFPITKLVDVSGVNYYTIMKLRGEGDCNVSLKTISKLIEAMDKLDRG